jgi:hypothetical protein
MVAKEYTNQMCYGLEGSKERREEKVGSRETLNTQ